MQHDKQIYKQKQYNDSRFNCASTYIRYTEKEFNI